MSIAFDYSFVPRERVIRGLSFGCAHLRGRCVYFARIHWLNLGRTVHGLEQTCLRLRALLTPQCSLDPHVRPNLPQLLSLLLIVLLRHRLRVLGALTHQRSDLELLGKLMMLLTLYLFDEAWVLIVGM